MKQPSLQDQKTVCGVILSHPGSKASRTVDFLVLFFVCLFVCFLDSKLSFPRQMMLSLAIKEFTRAT